MPNTGYTPRNITRDMELRVIARDAGASQTIGRIGAGLKNFATSVIARQLGTSMENAGKQILGLVENAGKMAVSFEAAFSKIGPLTGAFGTSIDKARQHVLDLAGATGQAPIDLANALYFVASAGLKTAQVMPVLDASAKGAAIGMGDVSTVGQTLTSVMNAYRGTQLNTTGVLNSFVEAVKLGKAEISDFATSLGPVIGVAANVGVSIQDLGAALAQVTNLGVTTSRAVTGLRFVLANLAAPTQVALKYLKEYHISAQSIYTDLSKPGGLEHVLQKLAATFNLSSQKGREAWRAVVGGARGAIVAVDLVGKHTKETNRLVDQMNRYGSNTADTFQKAFEVIKARNPALAMAMLWERIHAIEIEVGEKLLPALYKFLSIINRLANWFSNLSDGTKKLITETLILGGVFLVVTGRLLKLFAILKGFQALLNISELSMSGFVVSAGGMLVVVGGIAALGLLVIKNWKTVGPFFTKLGNDVKDAWKKSFGDIGKWWNSNGKSMTNQALDFAKVLGSFVAAALVDLAPVARAVVDVLGAFLAAVVAIAKPLLEFGTSVLHTINPALKYMAPIIIALVAAWKGLLIIRAVTAAFQTFYTIFATSGIINALSLFSTRLQSVKIATTGVTTAQAANTVVSVEMAAAQKELKAAILIPDYLAAKAKVESLTAAETTASATTLTWGERFTGLGAAAAGLAAQLGPLVSLVLSVQLGRAGLGFFSSDNSLKAAEASLKSIGVDTAKLTNQLKGSSILGGFLRGQWGSRTMRATVFEGLLARIQQLQALGVPTSAAIDDINRAINKFGSELGGQSGNVKKFLEDVGTIGPQSRKAAAALKLNSQAIWTVGLAYQDTLPAGIAWNNASLRAQGLTKAQTEKLAALVNGIYVYGGSLSANQQQMISNLLAYGDYTDALKLLRRWLDGTTHSLNTHETANQHVASAAADATVQLNGERLALQNLNKVKPAPKTFKFDGLSELINNLEYVNSLIAIYNKNPINVGAYGVARGQSEPGTSANKPKKKRTGQHGGWITEPLVGWGTRSGDMYTLAETESEYVTPKSKMRGRGGRDIHLHFETKPMTAREAVAEVEWSALTRGWG